MSLRRTSPDSLSITEYYKWTCKILYLINSGFFRKIIFGIIFNSLYSGLEVGKGGVADLTCNGSGRWIPKEGPHWRDANAPESETSKATSEVHIGFID